MTEVIEKQGAGVSSPMLTWTLPMFILVLSQIASTGYQVVEQWQKRSALMELRAGQAPAIAEAQKLRSALDRLAADTKALSDQGDPNARLLVVELEKRGVTINSK
jgi:hypothetical protein